MPEIKCEYGHTQSIGTDAWVATLTLDQMRYARDQMAEKIKASEESPKLTVWLVSNGSINEGCYREEHYDAAAEHLLRIYKERFIKEAMHFNEKPFSVYTFTQVVPSITPIRVTQLEYDTEWFPTKP